MTREIDNNQVQTVLAALESFAAERGLKVEPTPINLFGFGSVFTMLSAPDGGWWCPLTFLSEPTGVSITDLMDEFRDDIDDLSPDVGVVYWTDVDGQHQLPMVAHSFAFRALANLSPWSKEFLANSFALFRHAAVKSGLAEQLNLVQVDGDGTEVRQTFAEFLAQGDRMPSAEDAAAQAFQGPRIPGADQ